MVGESRLSHAVSRRVGERMRMTDGEGTVTGALHEMLEIFENAPGYGEPAFPTIARLDIRHTKPTMFEVHILAGEVQYFRPAHSGEGEYPQNPGDILILIDGQYVKESSKLIAGHVFWMKRFTEPFEPLERILLDHTGRPDSPEHSRHGAAIGIDGNLGASAVEGAPLE